MDLARELPSQQRGFWLPVYKGDEHAERAIKRIVLRAFRELVRRQHVENKIVRVKNFQWIQHEDYYDCICDPYSKTFGWKADVLVAEII